MAVYKRSLNAYTGELTPEWSRFLVITRFALADLFRSRIFVAAAVACFIPVLIGLTAIYVNNSTMARTLLQMTERPFQVNNQFFLGFMQIQGWLAIVLVTWAGPTLVASDLSNGALPLFLSRPITRLEYVAGKFMALFIITSAITWVSGLFLFALQVQLGPDGWLKANWFIAPGMAVGLMVWCALLAVVALAISAWVKWRIPASAMTFAMFIVPAGIGEVFNNAMRTHWGSVLNVAQDAVFIWQSLLRLPVGVWRGGSVRFVPVEFAWVAIIAVFAMCIAILNLRLKAREVVRG